MRMIGIALAAILALLSAPAFAQTCPTFSYGLVLTPGQWQACFDAKQNVLGFNPVNKAGDVMLGRLVFPAPTGSFGNLSLTPGSAPSAPTDGDMWVTPAGLYVQINGATVGPLAGPSAASFAATAPLTVAFSAGLTTFGLNIDSTLHISSNNLGIDLSHANVWTGQQTFTNSSGIATSGGIALMGSSSGSTTVKAAATASGTITLPAGTTDFSATGGSGQYVKQSAAGAALTVGTIAAADLPIATGSVVGAVKPDGTTLTVNGSGALSVIATAPHPTHTTLTTGSGTYTTPVGATYIVVKMIGGGGGGSGSGTGAGTGGTGGASCWNTSGAACTSPVLRAGGGAGGVNGASGAGGAGGTCSGTTYLVATGAQGSSGANGTGASNGGPGGPGFFGGAGGGGALGGGGGIPGINGGGGGGAGIGGTTNPGGSGGGSGCYLEAQINSPASTYTYAVGSAGSNGTAGTSGVGGGAGGGGLIIIDEYYN